MFNVLFESARHWLKTSIALLFIMGITWIIGVLVFHEALLFVAYIFTIFVAFQVGPYFLSLYICTCIIDKHMVYCDFFSGCGYFHHVHCTLEAGKPCRIIHCHLCVLSTSQYLYDFVLHCIMCALYRSVKTTRSGGEGRLLNQISSANTSLPRTVAVEREDW